MTEKIVQELGFDASNAITNINKVNKSLGLLNQNLATLSKSASIFNKSGLARAFQTIGKTNAASALNNAAVAAQKFGTNATSATTRAAAGMKNVKNKTESAVLSWQTLSRIIVAQTLVRGINAIKSATSEAVREMKELEQRIAEIQTIANGQLGSSGDIFESLQATSERFGLDIIDAAEAKYQELSNQIKNSTDSQGFFNQASKLALVTNSNLTDSVNVLSSVINAYGGSAEDAERVSSILFNTVKEGRVRLSEIANTLGRVLPLANSLGIGFNEIGASLSAITQGGTRADTGLTQILGIINKLTKPTDALKDAFQRLRVETAGEGIEKAGGLLPFLKQLQVEAGDNASLVKFFNNVRAVQGILALVGKNVERTDKVFGAFNQTTDKLNEIFEEAFKIVKDNPTQKFNEAMQQLLGTFRELSQDVIPLLTGTLKALNFLINNISNNKFLVAGFLGAAAGAMVTFAGTTQVAATALVAFAGSATASLTVMSPFLLTLAGLAAIGIVVKRSIDKMNEASLDFIDNNFSQAVAAMAEKTRVFNKSLNKMGENFIRNSAAVNDFLNQFSGLEDAALQEVRRFDQGMVASTKGALAELLSVRKNISKQVQDAVNKSDSLLTKSADKQVTLRLKKEDFLLQRQLRNFDDLRKASKLLEISRAKAFEVRGLIADADDLADFDGAAKVLDTRLKLAEQGLAAANASGNRTAIFRAEQQIATALNDQINLEKQRSAVIEQRRKAAEQVAAEDREQVLRLSGTIKELENNISILEGRNLLNPKEIAARREEIKLLLDDLRGQALSSNIFDVSEFLGIEDIAGRFSDRLRDTISGIEQSQKSTAESVANIFEEVNSKVDENTFRSASRLGLTVGSVNRMEDLGQATIKARKEFDELSKSQKALTRAETDLQKARDAVIGSLNPSTRGRGTETSIAQVKVLEETIKKLSESALVGTDDIENFLDLLDARATGIDLGPGTSFSFKDFDLTIIKGVEAALLSLQEAQLALSKTREESGADASRLAALNEFLTNAKKITGEQQTSIDRAKALNTVTNAAAVSTDTVQSSWKNVQKAIKDATGLIGDYGKAVLSAPAPPSGGLQRMFGGAVNYRAFGGTTRGTDSIPTMLSPNEFVVNAKSSRQFASQLQSINSGVAPVFRQEGGTVNNSVTVGDINVNGGDSPQQTARLVMAEIRRESRRGASRF